MIIINMDTCYTGLRIDFSSHMGHFSDAQNIF